MPNEIYHKSNWGNANAEGFGDVYFDAAATNKLYNHSDYYENSNGTDKILRDLSNKASVVLTPTAYSDGSLNTVIPPYQILPQELVTNGDFATDSDWVKGTGTTISSGNANFVNATGVSLYQNIGTQSGTVKVEFTVTNYTSGTLNVYSGGNQSVGVVNVSANALGLYTAYVIRTGGNVNIIFGSSDNFTGSIDNVSVKEIQEADFDFSRGSSATRVNEKGLIEDVQILSGELVQNGNFATDSDWTKETGWTISGGKANKEGATASNFYQPVFTSGKKYRLTFDISNSNDGRLLIYFGSAVSEDILSASDGTYSFDNVANNDTLIFRNVNWTGSIDNVSVIEITDDTDLPRIDYTSGFGSLLLEPQRTNLALNSNDLTESTWSTLNSATENSNIINPEGTSGASLYVCDNYTGNNQYFRINPNTTYSNDVDYTYSVFVKYNTFQFCKLSYMNFNGGEYFASVFDIINGSVTATDSNGTPQNTNANIQDFGNGWFRISISAAITSSSGNAMNFEFNKSPSGTPTFSIFGRTDQTTTTNDKIYVYGAQLEAGSYATSYIVSNSGSTTTRSADIANNSGNADLFNDSEGVLYVETKTFTHPVTFNNWMSINDGSASNSIAILFETTGTVVGRCDAGGVNQSFLSYNIDYTDNLKIAFKYKASDFSLFINGFDVVTFENGIVPTGLSEFDFNYGGGTNNWIGNVKELAVFKEALTDAELESLTSWVSFTEMATDLNLTIK